MKKTLIGILFLIMSINLAYANNYFKQKITVNKDSQGRELYHTDRFYIKLNKDIDINLVKNEKSEKIQSFGIDELDLILQKYKVNSIEKSFKQAKKLPVKVRDRMQSSLDKLPDLSRIYTVTVPQVVKSSGLVSELSQKDYVDYIEYVPIMYPTVVPNDERYNNCQHLPQIMAEEAWEIFKGEQSDSTIVIGISDTGTDWTHVDLHDNAWENLAEDADGDGTVFEWVDSLETYILDPGDMNGIDDDGNGYIDDVIGWDFLENYDEDSQGNDPMDYHSVSHGTHVAGLSAGVTDNEIGISSISWNVKWVATSHSSPSFGNLIRGYEGIVYLAELGCDVINCSWGGGGYSQAEADAVEYAASLGALIVVAAGNDNSSADFYPSAYPHLVSVSSVASNDKKASYSNYGRCVDISAPGGDTWVDGGLLSTYRNNQYRQLQGTSMASPVAAGIFGFLKAFHPDWTNEQLITQILGSSDYIDTLNTNYTHMLGAGRVNAYRALTDTEITIPQILKLGLMNVNASDEAKGNNNKALEPGETIQLSILLRNFALLSGSENTTLTISTLDPNVEILNESVAVTFTPDGFTETPYEFEVKIDEEAKSGLAEFILTAESEDAEIVHGQMLEFSIPINAGGILVWEPVANGYGYSGKFISDFLNSQSIEHIYTNTFPISMAGFDAVFLSFGSIGGNVSIVSINDWYAEDITEYVKAGGNLYIETMDGFAWDQKDNAEFLELFGVDSTNDGESAVHAVDTLWGQENSIMTGLIYKGTSYSGFQSVDVLVAGGTGVPALVEPYTDAVIQSEGEYGQKTVLSVYPVSMLVDRNHPNTRYEFIKRVMAWFGQIMEYTVPRYSYNPKTGHAPLSVDFADISYTSIAPAGWAWDFEGNGYIEGFESEVETWQFDNPGNFNPIMKVDNGLTENTVSNPVYVFDGESAANFSNSGRVFANDTNLNLSGALSVEAWINPNTLGQYNWGRIIDKNKVLFMCERNEKLRFILYQEDDKSTDLTTSASSVTFNIWQHVAATYDGDTTVHVYINGIEQELSYSRGPSSEPIEANFTQALVVGNRVNNGRGFNGRIDELRVWDKELTQTEIHNSMFNKLNGNEEDLLVYLPFEEGNGNGTEDMADPERMFNFSATWRQGWHPQHIVKQPESVNTCEGLNVSFTTEVIEGGNELEYKWFNTAGPLTDSEIFEGTETETLIINGVTAEHEGNYYLKLTDMNSSATEMSDEVSLTVNTLPMITTQPEKNIGLNAGETLNLILEAESNMELSYEWYRDSVALEIFTPTLSIENIRFEDRGFYWCLVSNDCGLMYSDTSDVKVLVGIEEYEDVLNFTINPNPANEQSILTITNPNQSILELNITDAVGKRIAEKTINNKQSKSVFNLNELSGNLSSGVYYINLKAGNRTITKPIIISK